MHKKALIGYTGFIGKNLKEQIEFSYFYNSKNITEIKDKEFDLVISCGNSSTRWLVNKNPEEDYNNIISFINLIKTVKTKKFVLISTIDVYPSPHDVDEDTPIINNSENHYGRNRLLLENAIKEIFPSYLIIRLPIIYGHGFKKNIIFDALNHNNIDKVNGDAIVQIYNVKNLGADILKYIENDCILVNLATEPIRVSEIYNIVFNIVLKNSHNTFFKYDFQTKHRTLSNNQKYFYNKKQIVDELKMFKEEYEFKRI